MSVDRLARPEPSRPRRRRAAPGPAADDVLVVGLGRFGSALADELVALGHGVLAVDADPELVQRHADRFDQVVVADATNAEALRQLGAGEFRQAVVGIGGDIEASILTVLALLDCGVPNVWAKAITAEHGRILERVGAHHVVFPEMEMGRRVAHLVTNRMLDYIALDDRLVLVEVPVPASLAGATLRSAGVREHHGVTVVCVKPAGGGYRMSHPDWELRDGDTLLVAGPPEVAEAFGRLA
ncbi:MAG: potassium channel family protein [Acidimicrobiales bacterium]